MGVLRALARARAARFGGAADALRREVDRLGEGTWINAAEEIATPAGSMHVQALGGTGPGSAVDLTFARIARDGLHSYDAPGSQGAGSARATVKAIEDALERLIAERNPVALEFAPTSESRNRLYAAMLARRGASGRPAYRRTDGRGPTSHQRWERDLTEQERAQLDTLGALRRQMGDARSRAYFWDDVEQRIGPIDNALTYGAPAAAVGGAGYALHQDMQSSDSLSARQYGLIQRALQRAIVNGER